MVFPPPGCVAQQEIRELELKVDGRWEICGGACVRV